MSYPLGYCERPATKFTDGHWYCWQHDPERRYAKARKRAEEQKKYEAELEAKWHRGDLERNSGVRDLTNQDLERIIAAGGIRVFLPWWPVGTDANVND